MLYEVSDILCRLMSVSSWGDAPVASWASAWSGMTGLEEAWFGGSFLWSTGSAWFTPLISLFASLHSLFSPLISQSQFCLLSATESVFSGKSLPEIGQMLLHFVLMWTGMAAIVGCLAKLMLPGVRPYGTCATMLLGMFSSTVGCYSTRFVFQEWLGRENFDPISLPGILVSVLVACLFLGAYQMVAKTMEPRN